MAKRRGNQEGSIFQKSNGKWRVQIMFKGGRLSTTVATRTEAQDWLRTTNNQIENGLTIKGANTQFGEFLDEWLATAKPRVTEHSLRTYEQIVRKHIRPGLGNIRLRDLNPSVIQRFYDRKVAEGLGLRTVQRTHTIIHAALNSAMKLGLLGRNPDNATTPPKPKRKEMKYLDAAQVKKLLDTARNSGDRNYALCYLAVSTGMREGELLGLRWDDVNLAQGILNVRFNLRRLSSGVLSLQHPKTKTSTRSIKIGRQTAEILQLQRIRNSMDAEKSGQLWKDQNFVFPSTVGTPMDPTNLLKAFRKLLRLAGLPKIRFHDLRHTAASLMLNNGVDVLIASQRLGHAKPSITLDVYGHLIPSMQSHAAEVLETLLSGK
jgi:integrase